MTMEPLADWMPGPSHPSRHRREVPPPRSGAFAVVRSRWLLLWAAVGTAVVLLVVAAVAGFAGGQAGDDLFLVLSYLPIIAWLWIMVVRRWGVDLRAMLRWPRLGVYWWVVAGLLVVLFLFSIAAISLSRLVFPTLGDSLTGIGEGNLLLALVGIVVLPPLVEEVLFRGILVERFAVKWRVGTAIVVSAVLFGILHVDPVGAGAFGVVTGLLYLRTGSLWPGILIHAANNLVALASLRLGGTEEPADVDPAGTLLVAAVLLAVTVPGLAWFIRTSWPRRGVPTPYQAHELATGLPSRSFRDVTWSEAPGRLRLAVGPTHLALSPGVPGAAPFALLPLERIQLAYPVLVPGGEQVVVLLHDGTWTTLGIGRGRPGAVRGVVDAINDRVAAAAGTVAA